MDCIKGIKIALSVEDVANILYNMEISKRANDGSLVYIELEEKSIDIKIKEREHGKSGSG